MKVEIWSDIQCPFCYIGKRKFEAGLAAFSGKDEVEVIWRSFQLNPDLKPEPGKDIYAYLAEHKGMSHEQSVNMHKQVSAMAAEVGLDYDFDKTVLANSFDAHRLIHLAKAKGLGDAAEERIFKAYFTEGADVADAATLEKLAVEIGLDAAEAKAVITTNAYSEAVNEEIAEAQSLGIRGVPFFVIDRKYGVSGAQAPEAFLGALEQAKKETITTIVEGNTCTTDGNCN